MATLERALQIAVQAHAGQEDKNGAPYIFHPIRVMMRCTNPHARIAALLHDVVEDTTVTLADLEREGFSGEIMATVRLLTHPTEVSYEDYIEGILPHPIAREVKIADLEDNTDLRRLQAVDDRVLSRLGKYLRAWQRLTTARDTALVS